MRFLNKIVFINSASVKYTEIQLDGNVHLIGTQGVGKSTLLRAILFFYNADKTKLGISREKANFDAYYFPYQNSYIIFEVLKDGVPFSVLAFKSQGRVAFRFFDAGYDKKYFIDSKNRAFENWQKIREAFGEKVYHTNIIHNYEEYRNILYGNNKGLDVSFRKYALLESKQYQNIPRTIQNVFLNSKLDAEFIKETIIKSLDEEEIKIDLSAYSHDHLRNFESELNDIKIWTNKNNKGEIPILKKAQAVLDNYRGLNFLEREKIEFAQELSGAVSFALNAQPEISTQLHEEQQVERDLKEKSDNLQLIFDAKKLGIQTEIELFKKQLATAKTKKEAYKKLHIEDLITRVSNKKTLESEKEGSLSEKRVLTAQYSEIAHKYEALVLQSKNQLEQFTNEQIREKNKFSEALLSEKEALNNRYLVTTDAIKEQQVKDRETCEQQIQDKSSLISQLENKKVKATYHPYYQVEIAACTQEKEQLNQLESAAKNKIKQADINTGNLRATWALEEEKIAIAHKQKETTFVRTKEQLTESEQELQFKIENSKDSLYGWLNTHIPDWNTNLGKVIDQEQVLFNKTLSPTLSEETTPSFYGVHLDLSKVNSSVKTVKEYKQELRSLSIKKQAVIKEINTLIAGKETDLKRLKKKFKSNIQVLKESIASNEYICTQQVAKLAKNTVKHSEFIKKASLEKEEALAEINKEIEQYSAEKLELQASKKALIANSELQLANNHKEKEEEIRLIQHIHNVKEERIKSRIIAEKSTVQLRITALKEEEKVALDKGGADTERIVSLDKKIEKITSELSFIEANRDTVVEYNKDKRELFDKLSSFTFDKGILEKNLAIEASKHTLNKSKLNRQLKTLNSLIIRLKTTLDGYKKSLLAFENFKKSETYPSVKEIIENLSPETSNDKNIEDLIKSITEKHYVAITRLQELQSTIIKFAGNFQEDNIFSFKTQFVDKKDYFDFAEMLQEFMQEDKISEYEKRVNERFTHILQLIAKQTGDLISKEGEIQGIITKINKDFISKNFVTAINSIEMRTIESPHKIMKLLIEIKQFNDSHSYALGGVNLFSSDKLDAKNEKAVKLLKQLVREINNHKTATISLSDSFGLEFRISENNNDTGWVEKLSNVGSEGTDVLVKAMINIMLLNVFKNTASKKFTDFKLHCMMDEIGKLHPSNIKGILKFANERNIHLINGSPTTYNAIDYKYTYLLSKDKQNVTMAKRLVKKI
ncbi:MAG: ATP-binding protein [Flavobacteriaceae bacterium]|nr:MAG: ATP-binding protein [Flavobacteriaceae bacterium]